MGQEVKKIAITGGAGQIAYSLLFRIASGEVFGKNQPLDLHILETSEAIKALEGVVMELQDCSFPLLRSVKIGDDPYELFKDVEFAILIGSKPRGPGMERKDLLSENGKIFIEQGKALNHASKNVKVLVVGNPCNTNCLIAMHHADKIPKKNFFALTRLDVNRARAMLAEKAKVSVDQIHHVTIWGNHSSTQVPDFTNAHISHSKAEDVIKDREWLEKTFVEGVQKRGAAVIAARGKSSAASAANAIIDCLHSIIKPTPSAESYSLCLYSKGNPYGVNEHLIFSFPCRTNSKGEVEIISDLKINPWLREKLKITENELLEEKHLIAHLI